MNKYLANISNALGGVSSLLIRQGGFAFGEGFTPAKYKGGKMIIEVLLNNLLNQ